MNRLIEIFDHNIFFHMYLIKNDFPHDWIRWSFTLNTVYDYLKANLDEKEYSEAEIYFTELTDKIYPQFHPVVSIDEKGNRDISKENAEKNEPVYPLMQEALEYIDGLMWDTIRKTGVPFVKERQFEDRIGLEIFITTAEKVIIPGKYHYISDDALAECPNLEEIVYEEGIVTVGKPGINDESKLKKVVFSSTVKHIGLFAFRDCTNLEEVVFYGVDTEFSYQSFENTKWFKEYRKNHKGNPFYIEAGTLFYYTGRRKILTIPENVKNIGDFALEDKNFEKIIFPDDLHYIGLGAFNGCKNLKYVVIPDNVEDIYNCFSGCHSLREVYLPENTRVGFVNETFRVSEHITVFGYRNNKSMQYIAKQPYVNYEFVD